MFCFIQHPDMHKIHQMTFFFQGHILEMVGKCGCSKKSSADPVHPVDGFGCIPILQVARVGIVVAGSELHKHAIT